MNSKYSTINYLIVIIFSLGIIAPNIQAKTIIIDKSQILVAASETANYMDIYRLVPTSVSVGEYNLNAAQALVMFTQSITLLNDGQPINFEDIPLNFAHQNSYPSIELIDDLYENVLFKNDYLSYCSEIAELSKNSDTIPNILNISNYQIRFPETLYIISSILRFYQMFGFLPETQEINIISSKGLVPWETPVGYEHYTSSINNLGNWFRRYNHFSVNQYDIFKSAMAIAEPYDNYYDAANWMYYNMNSFGQYTIYKRTFGSRMSTSEQLRHQLSNSAFPLRSMTGWARTLGIPISDQNMYDEQSGKWVNIDIHCPFGSDPDSCSYSSFHFPPLDSTGSADVSDNLIHKIKSVMEFSGTNNSGLKSFWVNPADINKYGAEYIVKAAKDGGFNVIILTIKSELGNLYYPTTKFSDKFEYDALSDLLLAIVDSEIQVYAGFSVFADKLSLDQHIEEWIQSQVENPVPGFPNMSISPCVCEYKTMITQMLQEISGIEGLSGIVLAHLYWDTINYVQKMGGNPQCEAFNTGEGWQEDLIEAYGTELIDTIKSINSNLEVLITSYPISWRCYPSFSGHEDKIRMADISDGLIVPYDGNFWLSDFEEWEKICGGIWDPPWPVPFELESYIAEISNSTSKPIYLSQNLTEEWMFPNLFYSGLLGYAKYYGANGINLHTPVSMLGEHGPSFRKVQLQKLSTIDFDENYITKIDYSQNTSSISYPIVIAYPNPFKDEVRFKFDLISSEKISLKIFDLFGREIESLAKEQYNKGIHVLSWQPPNLPDGVYYFSITGNSFSKSGKIVLKQ